MACAKSLCVLLAAVKFKTKKVHLLCIEKCRDISHIIF